MNEWQHIPEQLHPIAFTVGFFTLHWYAVLWLVGFAVALFFALWLTRQEGEGMRRNIIDSFFALFVGALIGGRLGYVLFYRPETFLTDPLRIFWPFDNAASWTGLAGMSFHGGLLGAILALLFFTRRRKLSFWDMADVAAWSLPLALFFGRLANFMNLELPGRVTTEPWGMYFPSALPAGALRHPSTLYEALLEGVVLFVLLFFVRRRIWFAGGLTAFFLVLYGTLRFSIEYLREPDWGISLICGLTRGQLLSLPMIGIGVFIYWWLHRKNHDKIVTERSAFGG